MASEGVITVPTEKFSVMSIGGSSRFSVARRMAPSEDNAGGTSVAVNFTESFDINAPDSGFGYKPGMSPSASGLEWVKLEEENHQLRKELSTAQQAAGSLTMETNPALFSLVSAIKIEFERERRAFDQAHASGAELGNMRKTKEEYIIENSYMSKLIPVFKAVTKEKNLGGRVAALEKAVALLSERQQSAFDDPVSPSAALAAAFSKCMLSGDFVALASSHDIVDGVGAALMLVARHLATPGTPEKTMEQVSALAHDVLVVGGVPIPPGSEATAPKNAAALVGVLTAVLVGDADRAVAEAEYLIYSASAGALDGRESYGILMQFVVAAWDIPVKGAPSREQLQKAEKCLGDFGVKGSRCWGGSG